MRRALGILGGTFDPVHLAHLRLAEEALDHLPLASIRWIPSGRPAHRGQPTASADQRVAMLKLAIAGNTRFELDECDAHSAEPTFTVNTLQRLRVALGDAVPLVLIIGADQLHALDTWHQWRRLFELAHVAVAERPGYEASDGKLPAEVALEHERRRTLPATLASSAAGAIAVFPMTALDIAATAIRREIASGGSARYLLPDSVLDYIASHQLYSKGTHWR